MVDEHPLSITMEHCRGFATVFDLNKDGVQTLRLKNVFYFENVNFYKCVFIFQQYFYNVRLSVKIWLHA